MSWRRENFEANSLWPEAELRVFYDEGVEEAFHRLGVDVSRSRLSVDLQHIKTIARE